MTLDDFAKWLETELSDAMDWKEEARGCCENCRGFSDAEIEVLGKVTRRLLSVERLTSPSEGASTGKKSIGEHAAAIQVAIDAAFQDGFELDDRTGRPVYMELNEIIDGKFQDGPIQVIAPRTYN